MDVLNLNSIINHCIRKTILSGDNLSAYYQINMILLFIIVAIYFSIFKYIVYNIKYNNIIYLRLHFKQPKKIFSNYNKITKTIIISLNTYHILSKFALQMFIIKKSNLFIFLLMYELHYNESIVLKFSNFLTEQKFFCIDIFCKQNTFIDPLYIKI